MKRSLKTIILTPVLAGLLVAGFAPAQAYTSPEAYTSSGKQVACTREYSATYDKLVRAMGKDSYRIHELMTKAVNNNTRIALEHKFQQEFAQYGIAAGKLAYQYYTESCWTI
ncbi:MAG TPA: hypothetical protein H9821_01315 [Candidatus Rothia avicola]|uniref:Uncharacterized protein n=1 Tax=Candidatus Rothia avicola TaxID=2840478 RepID=A0A9D2CQ92_9MICC|nr:hypothetical protein [Candidatus Rothia avicola]